MTLGKKKRGWTKKEYISYDDLRDVSKTWLTGRMRSPNSPDEVKDKIAIAVVSKDLPTTVKHEGEIKLDLVSIREKALKLLDKYNE